MAKALSDEVTPESGTPKTDTKAEAGDQDQEAPVPDSDSPKDAGDDGEQSSDAPLDEDPKDADTKDADTKDADTKDASQKVGKDDPKADQTDTKSDKDPKADPKDKKPVEEWRTYPRAAQRAIHRANKKLKAEQEKRRLLEERLTQEQSIVPDPDAVKEDYYRQKELSMRTQLAQTKFQSQVETLPPAERELLITEGQSISLDDKPITTLALLEHPQGARLAVEIAKDPRIGDLFEEADDRQALQILDSLARNLQSAPKSSVPKKAAPKKADVTPTQGKTSGTKATTPLDMGTKDFANWLGM